MRVIGLLAAALVFSVTACGDDGGSNLAPAQADAGGTATPDVATTTPDAASPAGESDAGDQAQPDTTTPSPDTTAPPADEPLYCFDILPCVIGAGCAQTDQTCLMAALQACQGRLVVEDTGVWQSYFQCYSGCTQTAQGDLTKAVECLEAGCLDAESACRSGGTFGEAGCSATLTCVSGCQGSECMRGCYSNGDSAAIALLARMDYCVSLECQGLAQTQLQGCIQQAVAPNGACNALATECENGPTVDPMPTPDAGPSDDAGSTTSDVGVEDDAGAGDEDSGPSDDAGSADEDV